MIQLDEVLQIIKAISPGLHKRCTEEYGNCMGEAEMTTSLAALITSWLPSTARAPKKPWTLETLSERARRFFAPPGTAYALNAEQQKYLGAFGITCTLCRLHDGVIRAWDVRVTAHTPKGKLDNLPDDVFVQLTKTFLSPAWVSPRLFLAGMRRTVAGRKEDPFLVIDRKQGRSRCAPIPEHDDNEVSVQAENVRTASAVMDMDKMLWTTCMSEKMLVISDGSFLLASPLIK